MEFNSLRENPEDEAFEGEKSSQNKKVKQRY